MMRFNDPKMTARDAANRFAAEFFDKPREIGVWKHDAGRLKFRLVGGMKWYQVIQLGHVGWEVVEAA